MARSPALRSLAPVQPVAQRVIDATTAEIVDAVLARLPDVLVEFLAGEIKPPPEYLTRAECAELLRISVAQLDILSSRDVDPLPYQLVGDSRRFWRADVRAWVTRQKAKA